MASVSEPCWKQPYATEQFALESAQLMNGAMVHEKQAKKRRTRMRPYRCPKCRLWHLTKQRQRT